MTLGKEEALAWDFSICKLIVEQHGGEIGVESEERQIQHILVYRPDAGAGDSHRSGQSRSCGGRCDMSAGRKVTIIVAGALSITIAFVAALLLKGAGQPMPDPRWETTIEFNLPRADQRCFEADDLEHRASKVYEQGRPLMSYRLDEEALNRRTGALGADHYSIAWTLARLNQGLRTQ